jgi:hypothetical protein
MTPSPKYSQSSKSSINSIKEVNKQSLPVVLVSRQARLEPYRLLLNTWFKVERGHTSATCTRQQDRHNTEATHSDPKGGSEANKSWTPDT